MLTGEQGAYPPKVAVFGTESGGFWPGGFWPRALRPGRGPVGAARPAAYCGVLKHVLM
jgi:hypothetical protein